MRGLFDQTVINNMTLANRLVRSATWEGMCEADGRPTARLADFYRALAGGGVGLLITGYAFVRPDGKQLPGKMGVHTDDFAQEMRALAEAVHSEDGRICMQLVHAGGQTDSANAGGRPKAPSALKTDQYPETPVALSLADIAEIIAAFGAGAGRAKAWGFDAVQLHGAHGYLINQFLSPLTNKRADQYGGGIANRSRFLQEVYGSVRQAVGPDFPVLIKLNGADNLAGGLTIDDAVYAAEILSAEGIDAIEVSGGTPASGEQTPVRANILKPEQEAYNLPLARRIKEKVSCPIMVVGGFRSYAVAEETIQADGDYIAMARPFIREPDLPRRWQSGDRTPAHCISCNKCFLPGLKEGGIYCVIEKKEKELKKGTRTGQRGGGQRPYQKTVQHGKN